jgi:hypothetical protein
MKSYLMLLVTTAALFAACNRQPPNLPAGSEASARTNAASLAERLNAATQISSLSARDDALARVAVDAAKAKQTTVTKAAVQGIGTVSIKDRIAEECALALTKAGETAAARETAAFISSLTVRDRTLGAIAKGR